MSDLDRFPSLPDDKKGRKLFFDECPPEVMAELQNRGYDPVIITTMPTATSKEKMTQLEGIGQGLADGTIQGSTQRLKGIELAMRSLGMLSEKSKQVDDRVKDRSSTLMLIEELKGKQGSTLRNEASVVDRDTILEKFGGGAKVKKSKGTMKGAKSIKKEKL